MADHNILHLLEIMFVLVSFYETITSRSFFTQFMTFLQAVKTFVRRVFFIKVQF
jgi:hypothetical protein